MGSLTGFFIGLFVTTAVSVGASLLLAPKPPKIQKPKPQPKPPDPKLPRQEDPGRNGNIKSAESPHAVVYGLTIKGGTLAYINGTGPDNLRLHQALCLAGHECHGIGDILLDSQIAEESEVNPSADSDINDYINTLRATGDRELVTKYTSPINLLRLTRHLGTDDQTADPDLVSENANWTSEHRGRGIAYLRTRYSYKEDVFKSFIPTTTCEVYGKKVYDPRSDLTVWSMNPALIAADILETIIGVDRSNIDQACLIAAADVCDESVETKSDEITPRYTANGFFELDGNWEEYLTPVINAMAGAIVEWGGTYYIKAGAWDEDNSDVVITDEDIMGAISRQTADSDQSRSNSVKGTYISPASYDSRTEFPLYKDAVAIAEDGGVVNFLELQLDFVNDHRQAQRLARIALNESRLDETITIEVTLAKGFDVLPWDNVTLQSDLLGVDDTYRVSNLRLVPGGSDSPSLVPELTLSKHNSSVYDWDADNDELDIQNAKTNLPGVGDGTAPTNGTYSLALNTTHANQIAAVATVNWDDPIEDVVEIEVEIEIDFEESAAGSGGPWTERNYTALTTVAVGVETAVINLGDNSVGPFDFQNHSIVSAVMRAKLDDTSYSADVALVAS